METLEITGTTYGTPRQQWAAERSARTATSSGTLQTCVYVSRPAEMQFLGGSPAFWAEFSNQWELLRLSRRTQWGPIMGWDPTQGGLIQPAASPAPAVEAPVGDVEILGRIRHYLSINISELASVLRVGRPTVYAWMEGGAIRPSNRERLTKVHRIARDWWNRAHQPLGSGLHLRGPDDQSLFNLLLAEQIDEAILEPFFKTAARRLLQAAQEKTERATPYSVLAKRHGFAPLTDGARERTLRQLNQERKRH